MSKELKQKNAPAVNTLINWASGHPIHVNLEDGLYISRERELKKIQDVVGSEKSKDEIFKDFIALSASSIYHGENQKDLHLQAAEKIHTLLKDGGIDSHVLDHLSNSLPVVLIDTTQEKFYEKMNSLNAEKMQASVENALENKDRYISSIIDNILKRHEHIPLDSEGKPVSKEQAADFLASAIQTIEGISKKYGVENMVEQKLKPKTGMSRAKSGNES